MNYKLCENFNFRKPCMQILALLLLVLDIFVYAIGYSMYLLISYLYIIFKSNDIMAFENYKKERTLEF